MTTSQIMESLRTVEATREVNDKLSSILELADFVKFANMRPLPDENEVMYQRSLTFVNETKPEEQPEGENEGEAKAEGENLDPKEVKEETK